MALFTFEGIGLILPVQHVMANPGALPGLLKVALVLLATVFVTFGFSCYVAYGEETHSMITFNIEQNKITSFLRLFYCLGLLFTYLLQMFPVYQLLEKKYRCLRGTMKGVKVLTFRSVVVATSGVVAVNIPNFGLFLGLIGAVCCTLLAFILPALFHLKRIDRSDATRQGDIVDMLLIAFGCVGGSIAFVQTLSELFRGGSGGGHR
eukprot:gnl/MRDRNA2_/MRDRNA2_23391_c0_seq1.p1 gnl/MRDRNA2_/MRDRNA2_23391_c0~~gnl/MRDRNA2_/MRDRNA2_23391_c0_seq1.p1  ORF type:complete len:242 (+),score=17.04 gnl/MRDRNA2_/MRDRNA2_23391_c0_seq1:110-727(+)